MERLNLLEKLKTLKQWQLQQQQQQQNEFSSYSDEFLRNNIPPSDKSNDDDDDDDTQTISKQNFMNTMTSSSLVEALRKVDLNMGDSIHSDCTQSDSSDIDSVEYKQNHNENGFLKTWNLAEMKTVVFNPPISASYHSQDIENIDTISHDGSENVVIDGVRPLTDTEDENYTDNDDNDDDDAVSFIDEEGLVESDEENQTVIEVPLDEKPIAVGSPGFTFEQLVERELQKEKQVGNITASTPVKKNSRQFLRRGEGLKRYVNTNYVKQLKENVAQKKENHQKKQDYTRTKTAPGLPLKLNLNKEKSSKQKSHSNMKHLKNTIVENGAMNNIPNDEVTKKKPQSLQKRSILSSVSSSVLESSFQKMLTQYHEREEVENNELDMFEALEEAAENISLSSNSSLVAKLLGKKRRNTVNKNSPIQEIVPVPPSNQLSNNNEDNDEDGRSTNPLFEDADSWSDTSRISSINGDDDTLINDDTLNNNDSCKMENDDEDDDHDEEDDDDDDDDVIGKQSPPPRRIISKRKGVSPEKYQNVQNAITETNNPSSNDISSAVKQKLAELENEISKFRLENDKLLKLRHEREIDLKKLRKEIDDFQREKSEELQQINNYRDDETKKLKAERKVFEKYQKATRAIPNKQEREEIKLLKNQVHELEDELKSRESRWNSANHRFRSRITELEEDNKQLREELKILEKERLLRRKHKEKDIIQKTSQVDSIHQMRSPPAIHNTYIENSSPSLSPPVQSNGFTAESNISTKQNISPLQTKNNEIRHEDGKIEVILSDGSKLITFPNGTKKTISGDEQSITIAFFNGDIKKLLPDQKVVYYYAESQTTHTTFSDGMEMLEFPNKQIEKRYIDGRVEIIFPDQTIKYVSTNGCEETVFVDGTVQKIDEEGVTTITFTNGQKEIHTKQYKRREYPNGTVKTVYEDGRQETKYSNGRLRVKDKNGALLIDTAVS